MLGKRILLIGDDHSLRQSLAEQLRLQDDLVIDETPEDGLGEALAAGTPLAAVLAVAESGGETALCRRLRAEGVEVPVILLAPANVRIDPFLTPECGASDVVVKPIRLGVLLARLRAQLSLRAASGTAALGIGPYQFRPAAKLLEGKNDERIRLTEKEAAILSYLYRAGGRVVAREELLVEVCGYTSAATTHTLETHIYRLRRKIERDPARAEILLTETGGYRLMP
jgi:DNA-binding response OmpR family regulator